MARCNTHCAVPDSVMAASSASLLGSYRGTTGCSCSSVKRFYEVDGGEECNQFTITPSIIHP